MSLWKLSASKKAFIVGVLTFALAFSGVDARGIARAFAETTDPIEEVGLVNQGAGGGDAGSNEAPEGIEPSEAEPLAAEAHNAATPEGVGIEPDAVDGEPSLYGQQEQVEKGTALESDSASPLSTAPAADGTPLTLSQSADGITATLTWVTEDSKVVKDSVSDQDPSTLELIPGYEDFEAYSGNDSPLSLEARLEFALSGESDFEPGSTQITLPAQFVKDRSGSYIGSVTIDVPEEPDTSQEFAYRLETPSDGSDPYYVITNTRALAPDTPYVIDVTYDDITPHEVESGAEHVLQATLSATTTAGSDVVADIDELVVTIATHEDLSNAHKNGGAVVDASDAPEAIQAALDAVAGTDKTADDYVLVRWNTYATVEGNQTFTLTMTDALGGQYHGNVYPAIKNKDDDATVDSDGSVVLGTSANPAESPNDSFSLGVITDGYLETGETHYETVWTAYPKSLFVDGTTYEITNAVTWTIAGTDGDSSYAGSSAVESLFTTASITYKNPVKNGFVAPTDYYHINKGTLEPHAYATSDNAALSELADGNDVTVGFTVTGSGEIMKQTMAADDPTADSDIETSISDGTKTVDDYYHKRSVTLELSDDALYLNEGYGSELAANDYHVSKVSLQDPLVYTYEQTGDDTSSWDFVRNTTGQLPDMALYGLRETEGGTATTWTKLATVSYSDTNARTVASAANGVSVEGALVKLDESLGITRVKLIAAAKDYDKMQLRYNPYITLHADSARIQPLLDEVFGASATPTATVRNDATLLAYYGNGVNGVGDDAPSIDPTTAQIPSDMEAQDNVIALTRNYTPTQEMRRTSALDKLRYGTSMEHATSLAYLRGAVPHVGVTSTKSLAYDKVEDLDATAMQAKLHYSAAVHEQSNITSRSVYQSCVEQGSIVPETSGTWYDLLPAGVEPVISSIALRDADAIEDAYAIKNYQGSGRTLLVVKAKLVPDLGYSSSDDYWAEGFYDEPQISFDALYNYADYIAEDDGKDHLVNVIAFESGNDTLGDVEGFIGEPDDASVRDSYNNKQTADAVKDVEDIMSNLDSSLAEGEKKPTFVYARSEDRIEIDRSIGESTKTVASDTEGVYRTGTGEDANQVNVYEGQEYTYRISVGSSSASTGVVIYDALESYEPSESDPDYGVESNRWKGTFVSVDTTELEDAGIEPVVYYSTDASLTSSNISEYASLSGSSSWSTTQPSDLSAVTAIAIDCSKNADGSDFTLSANSSLSVYIHMTAPVETGSITLFSTDGGKDDPNNNAHAFNSAYMSSSSGSGNTSYTKVGILPFEVEVSKLWDDGDDQDGVRPESVTVHLLANGEAAKDAMGSEVAAITLGSAHANDDGYSDGGWAYTYQSLPMEDDAGNAIRYTVTEDAVTASDGSLYTPSYERADDTHLRIVNKRACETVDVCGTKTWNDNADAAGARPSSIQVRLYADGVLKATRRIAPDASGTWSYAFTDLPANNRGEKITYTVEEVPVDKYAADYSASDAGSGSTVTSDGTISGSTDIRNTYSATGMLAIEKTVEGAKSDASKNTSFSFVVELFDSTSTADGDANDPQPLYGPYPYTVVDADGEEVSSGSVSTGGTITLCGGQRALIKDIPAGSTYKVTEKSHKGFVLSSSENTSGTVMAAPNESHATVASFTNTYSSKGSFRLKATKVLTGKVLERQQFSFEAYQVDGESKELVGTASNGAGSALDENNKSTGIVSFSRVNVTNDDLGEDGTLTLLYGIREVIPEGATGNADGTYTYEGYTYAGNVEQVRVKLTDNGDGTITATQTAESDGDATFSNAYVAAGELDLVAYKFLIGRDLTAKEFSFTLEALTAGAPKASDMTAKNDADGTVAFPTIALQPEDAGKTYIYKATEDAGNDTGVIYSTEAIYYRVNVTDDGTGKLVGKTAVVVPKSDASNDEVTSGTPDAFEATGASATFTNRLKPGSLSITKKLADGTTDPVADGTEFTFNVRLIGPDIARSYQYTVGTTSNTANVTDGVLTLTLKGGQTATIKGIAAGTTYQVFEQPTVDWQLDGQAGASGTIKAAALSTATFTNKPAWTTAQAHLYVSKTLDGKVPEGRAFTFTLTANGIAPMPAGASDSTPLKVTNDDTGLVDFGAITYNQAGTYTYTITEEAGTDGTINYDIATWTATVTVAASGSALSIASVRYQRIVADSSTPPVFANTSKSGTLTVEKIGENVTENNKDDKFDFTVELMNDGEPVSITSYDVEGATVQTASSTDGVYSFTLKANQAATFSNLPAGTTYTVAESSQPQGWTQTAASNLHGTVPADATVDASVTNTYAATGSISLQATKTMASGTLAAGQFSFELLDEDDKLLQTVSNLTPGIGTATARVLFDRIDYDASDVGTHTYTVREVVPGEATNSDGTKWVEANDETRAAGGFVYGDVIYGRDTELDPLSQTIYVKVEDAGGGKLTVKMVDEDGNEVTTVPNFTNNTATGSLKVTKTVIGANEATKDLEFRFVVYINSATGQPISGSFPITYYDASGKKIVKEYPDGPNAGETIENVSFAEGYTEGITNIKSGECFVLDNLPAGTTYRVVEMSSSCGAGFTQTAATNVSGTIAAGETSEASFTNTYEVEGGIALQAQKVLEGASLDDYTFTFQLYDEDNNLLQTKTTDEMGLVAFDEIGFTATDAGTEDNPKVHRYRIVEVNDQQKNIVYDTHAGWVEVSVWDNGTDNLAQLMIDATYEHESGDSDGEPGTFTNKYQASTQLPMVGGSGLAVPLAVAVIVVTSLAALLMRRRRWKA